MVKGILLFCCCTAFLFSCTSKQKPAASKPLSLGAEDSIRIKTRIVPPSGNAAFRNITPAEGLPTTSVSDIDQDALGFIWIGTWDGVYRYDGNSFEKISLSGRFIEADDKGGVWIAKGGQGIEYYNAFTDSIKIYRIPNASSYPHVSIDESGGVWVTMTRGIAYLDNKADSFRLEEGLQQGFVDHLSARGNGELIFRLRTEDKKQQLVTRDSSGKFGYLPFPYDRNNSLKGKLFTDSTGIALLPFGADGMLLANRFGWAYKESSGGEWVFKKPAGDEKNILPSSFVGTRLDSSGNLWFVKENGLSCIDIRTGRFVDYRNNPENRYSILPFDPAREGTIFFDRQGVLWCTGFSYGISRLNLFENDFGLLRYDNGSPVTDVLSALELKDGSFWIGSRIRENGLLHFGSDGKLLKRYGSSRVSSPSGRTISTELSHPYVHELALSADGSVWAGTGNPAPGNGGLNRIRPGNDQITRFKFDSLDKRFKNPFMNWIGSIMVDRNDHVWFSSRNNPISSIDPATEEITVGIKNPQTGVIDTTSYLPVFVMSNGSLLLFDSRKFRPFFLDHKTIEYKSFGFQSKPGDSLLWRHQDEKDRVWFVSPKGFGYLDSSFKNIAYGYDYAEKGVPAMDIRNLNSDKNGLIWLATNNGIFQFDPATEQFRHFGYERGLQGNSFERWSHKGPSGKIYFGGYGGVNIFDPASIKTNPYPPQMTFTGLKLDGKSIGPGEKSVIQQPIFVADRITVGPAVDVISIDFAAIHFAADKVNKYQYKLEGFDKNWREGGTIGNATYTNLSPGKYTLYIKASNWDGVWSDGKKSIFIRILPPWWQTWWAYTIYGLLFLLLLWQLHRYQRSRTIRRERERSQQRELEQAKEIEKAYHELKATQQQLIQSEKMASLGELTAGIAHEIQNPLNFVNNFSEINKEMLAEMREEIKKKNFDEVNALAKDVEENEEKIIFHGKRADAIVKSMLQHSTSSGNTKEPTNINALADEYLRLSYHGLRAKDKSFNATINTDFDESIGSINIIPQDIGRVLLNLINNAFYAVSGKPNPTVSVSTKKINNTVEIKVKDNGTGIPPEVINKIFQPFFTTKPTGQGTGLGLSLSYDIVKAHGGELKVETKEGEGSGFIICLPDNG